MTSYLWGIVTSPSLLHPDACACVAEPAVRNYLRFKKNVFSFDLLHRFGAKIFLHILPHLMADSKPARHKDPETEKKYLKHVNPIKSYGTLNFEFFCHFELFLVPKWREIQILIHDNF